MQKREEVMGAGKSGGRAACGQGVLYERKVNKEKEKSKVIVSLTLQTVSLLEVLVKIEMGISESFSPILIKHSSSKGP